MFHDKLSHVMTPMSRSECLAAINAVLENARDLVSDARVLFKRKRYPTAYALAALATEEYGKCIMLLGAAHWGSRDSYDWAVLERRMKSHPEKLAMVAVLDFTLTSHRQPTAEIIKRCHHSRVFAAQLDIVKQKGFYVSVTKEKLSLPRAAVTKLLAHEMLNATIESEDMFSAFDDILTGQTGPSQSAGKKEYSLLHYLDHMTLSVRYPSVDN